jgi:hypothetical protein
MGTNCIDIQICESSEVAPDYRNGTRGGEGFSEVSLQKAVIVRNGTCAGNDTVDIQFVDAAGNKYFGMITAALLKTVADLCVVR